MKRRSFLAGSVLSFLIRGRADAAASVSTVEDETLLRWLTGSDRPAARRDFANRCGSAGFSREEATRAWPALRIRLKERLDAPTPAAARDALCAVVREDFRQGRSVAVEGWCLAHSEVVLSILGDMLSIEA